MFVVDREIYLYFYYILGSFFQFSSVFLCDLFVFGNRLPSSVPVEDIRVIKYFL